MQLCSSALLEHHNCLVRLLIIARQPAVEH
jgi:hypothetical protein